MDEEIKKYYGRVLIVDDDRDYSDGLVEIIEAQGYEVDQAFNKRDAIEKLDVFDPEIILLDLKLGRASGVDILDEVRDRNHPAICILLTAYSTIDSAIDALRRGAYDYLQKPVPPEKLINIVENCSDRVSMEKQIKSHQVNLEDLIDERTAELTESKEMYKTLAKVSPVGIMRVDKNNECVYVNDKWHEMICNETTCTMNHSGWYNCIIDSNRENFLADWNDFIESDEQEFRTECQFYHDAHSYKWVIFQATKVDSGGCVATAVDITPQKEILPQLVQFKKSFGGGQ